MWAMLAVDAPSPLAELMPSSSGSGRGAAAAAAILWQQQHSSSSSSSSGSTSLLTGLPPSSLTNRGPAYAPVTACSASNTKEKSARLMNLRRAGKSNTSCLWGGRRWECAEHWLCEQPWQGPSCAGPQAKLPDT